MPTATLPTGTPPGTVVAGVPAAVGRVLPPLPLTVGLFGLGAAAFAVSFLRPKQFPKPVQIASDVVTLTVVGAHPFEALALDRYAKFRGADPKLRRRAALATTVFGVFAAFPSLRTIRRSTAR